MRKFEDALELEWIDGTNWRVTADFYYDTDVDTLGRIWVEKNFITDFASIPRMLWNILPPTGLYGKAAVVHDKLYRTPGLARRIDADQVLLEAMEVCGVGWWTRHTVYAGVRAGGWLAYKGGL